MTRQRKIPVYRLHKASGQAIVTLPDGVGGRKDFLLGDYDTDESRAEYGRLIAEWLASGWTLPVSETAPADLSVNELLLRYYRHAEAYYVKDGKPTSEPCIIKQALRFVKRLYGHTLAKNFGPLALKAVRDEMVRHKVTRTTKDKTVIVLAEGLCRGYINKQISRIKRMFSWAVENELVPASVTHALREVKGLGKGRSGAREKARIKPVADHLVNLTVPHMPPVVADMVRVQRLAGMRPQEVVQLRACDLDMTGPVWEYRPLRYKTEHHEDDRERIIFLGPRSQAILKHYLPLNTAAHLFSPRQSEDERNAVKKANRKSPMTPSQAARRPKKRRAPIRDHYDVGSYRRAVQRACDVAFPPSDTLARREGETHKKWLARLSPEQRQELRRWRKAHHWHPNQLRHSAGTEVRKRFGLEASQAVLGHAELGVTQVYAETDLETARRVMQEIG